MQSPPPIPRGAWPLTTMISFWPLNFWGPPQVCLERRYKEKRPWTVCQEQVGAFVGGQGSLGCAVLPATFWFCRNKLQGQSQRENEVTKYAAGRKSAKRGGAAPVPLGMADAGTRGGDRAAQEPCWDEAVTRQWGPKNGREKRGEQYKLRIEISPMNSGSESAIMSR